MPLLNYSTKISVDKSAYEIMDILRTHGADAIQMDFDLYGNITGLKFKVVSNEGALAFELPARTGSVKRIMQNSKNNAERLMGNKQGQPERVAWRILKSWIQAQMALIEVGMVDLDEVFSPYLSINGSTLWRQLKEGRLQQLMLPSGQE